MDGHSPSSSVLKLQVDVSTKAKLLCFQYWSCRSLPLPQLQSLHIKHKLRVNNSGRFCDVMNQRCHKQLDDYQHYAALSTAGLLVNRKRVCYRFCTVMFPLRDYCGGVSDTRV
jgi:hypothetical protein